MKRAILIAAALGWLAMPAFAQSAPTGQTAGGPARVGIPGQVGGGVPGTRPGTAMVPRRVMRRPMMMRKPVAMRRPMMHRRMAYRPMMMHRSRYPLAYNCKFPRFRAMHATACARVMGMRRGAM